MLIIGMFGNTKIGICQLFQQGLIVFDLSGFAANYFSGKAFVNRADISSAMGSFAVGFLGNMYGKFTKGSPFVVMVVG